MTAAVVGLLAFALLLPFAWFTWDCAHWRREAFAALEARWASEKTERETLAALTDDDRAWLAANGWVDQWAPPTRAELTAGTDRP